MKALPNNNKPATHFIEVWKSKEKDICSFDAMPRSIDMLYYLLESTSYFGKTTIAIFKIRLK